MSSRNNPIRLIRLWSTHVASTTTIVTAAAAALLLCSSAPTRAQMTVLNAADATTATYGPFTGNRDTTPGFFSQYESITYTRAIAEYNLAGITPFPNGQILFLLRANHLVGNYIWPAHGTVGYYAGTGHVTGDDYFTPATVFASVTQSSTDDPDIVLDVTQIANSFGVGPGRFLAFKVASTDAPLHLGDPPGPTLTFNPELRYSTIASTGAPEPGTLALLAVAALPLTGTIVAGRRRRKG